MEKKRIIFDLNGTLFEGLDYESRLRFLLNCWGIEYSDEEIKRCLSAMIHYEEHYDHYTIDDYTEYLRSISGLKIDNNFIKYFLSRADILAPERIEGDIVDVLEYLSKRYDLAVLTNYFAYAQAAQMDHLGIVHYFSEICGGEKAIKPNKEAFLAACGAYKPEECIMIGDDPKKDIEGARMVPMDAIYYNRKGNINSSEEINDIKHLKYIL